MPMTSTSSTTTPIPIVEVLEETTTNPKLRTEIIDSPKTVDESIATINALNTTNGENVKSEKVEKSTQSIKTILIGL